MIYLNMPVGELYGWAICGKYLLRNLSEQAEVGYIEGFFENQLREQRETDLVESHKVQDCVSFGKIIHTLTPSFTPSCRSWGNKNIGYMFHEKETLSDVQKKNLHRFDFVIAGSEWNASVIKNHGIDCVSIPQGVDQSVFKYRKRDESDKFAIFSGGKWEKRKGQKIVIEAFKVLSKRYKDVCLIASWDNLFNQNAYHEIKDSLRDLKNVLCIGMQNHKNLAEFMHETDIAVFPNEYEGGTNLVLMEYLSSGRTAVVNVSTGQKDVVSEDYAYCMDGKDLLDDTIALLDYAYHNRREGLIKGKLAHQAMSQFSWGKMAERFVSL